MRSEEAIALRNKLSGLTFEVDDVVALWAQIEGSDAVQEELYGSYAGFKIRDARPRLQRVDPSMETERVTAMRPDFSQAEQEGL